MEPNLAFSRSTSEIESARTYRDGNSGYLAAAYSSKGYTLESALLSEQNRFESSIQSLLMPIHELAGKPAPASLLDDIPRLVTAYFTQHPDKHEPTHAVSFGTSGHRGSSLKNTFNEDHIAAISQAISEYREAQGIRGPLFLGKDTHALSEPAFQTAVEVFTANGVELVVQDGFGFTPTPVISHAILGHNRNEPNRIGDGVVITPSHNPPCDGGFKYNSTNGGPADADVTGAIQRRANEILHEGLRPVKRIAFEQATSTSTTHRRDFITPYVDDLMHVVDLEAVSATGLKIGVDPLGGSGIGYWEPIADKLGNWRMTLELYLTLKFILAIETYFDLETYT